MQDRIFWACSHEASACLLEKLQSIKMRWKGTFSTNISHLLLKMCTLSAASGDPWPGLGLPRQVLIDALASMGKASLSGGWGGGQARLKFGTLPQLKGQCPNFCMNPTAPSPLPAPSTIRGAALATNCIQTEFIVAGKIMRVTASGCRW